MPSGVYRSIHLIYASKTAQYSFMASGVCRLISKLHTSELNNYAYLYHLTKYHACVLIIFRNILRTLSFCWKSTLPMVEWDWCYLTQNTMRFVYGKRKPIAIHLPKYCLTTSHSLMLHIAEDMYQGGIPCSIFLVIGHLLENVTDGPIESQ